MTKILTLVLFLAAAPSSAQSSGPADRNGVRADAKANRPDNAAQKAQIANLNAQEKSAMDAVTADATLSKSAGDAAKRRIHADFKAKKDAIRVQMKVDRKAKRGDASGDRKDANKGRQVVRPGAK